MPVCIQAKVGEEICAVSAIAVNPTYFNILPGRIARIDLSRTSAVHPQNFTELQPKQIKEFLCSFQCDCACCQIRLQIGPAVLIQSSRTDGKAVGFYLRNQLHQPNSLQGFMER